MKKSIPLFIAALAAALIPAAPSRAADDGVATTPTIQAAPYASGNSLGGLQTVPFFRNAYLSDSGVLDLIALRSASGATAPIAFYIFDTLPVATTCADKTAFALGAADIPKLALQPFVLTPAAVTGASYTDAQLVQVQSVKNQDTPNGRVLYVCLVLNAATTPPSTTDITFKLSGFVN